MEDIKNLSAYLKSKQDLYTFGVPERFFDELSEEAENIRLLFLCDSQGEERELLKKSIENGLELDMDEVKVKDSKKISKSKFEEMCLNEKPEIVVFLGNHIFKSIFIEQEVKEGIFEFLNCKMIITETMKDCLNSPKVKKKYWEDLKRIKACL